MALLTLPKNHKPRFSNFNIDGILDETLREGSERCPFSVQTDRKIPLISTIFETGVRDIVFGSGPKDPTDLASVIKQLVHKNKLPSDAKFSFIMLLNCHEPLMKQFKYFPDEFKKYVTISFGMVSHKSDEKTFERATEELRGYGFTNFRVSLLNNFSSGVDEVSYEKIIKEIDRTLHMDINVVRINDSLGTIYPEAMAILAANLRHDYPLVNFCLHAHNDRGLGLQNALVSIYNGFNLIEGGFAGTGNRSGLPAIEILNFIFKEKSISIKDKYLDSSLVLDAARLTERTFLSIPDLYKPVSGHIVEQENMGVANIPSFLGAARDIPYFLNSIGLHDATLQKIMSDEGLLDAANDPSLVQQVKERFDSILVEIYSRKEKEFEQIRNQLEQFYATDVLYTSSVGKYTREFLK
ncbi:isopropylmalate synthase [Xenorhabdus miraniensis]|uniref:Isopropylmalate synthase n=1 Tax=Xenorhabdus miraniensis TaxID=351674 RepID=A0A2D0JU03_9GAMM|nr:isopropylmalate synthase [Xenorhabdus miraniensis]PHM49695.1 isopropylmalate synthase [Xenorhabdus miraniensis]